MLVEYIAQLHDLLMTKNFSKPNAQIPINESMSQLSKMNETSIDH